MDKNLKSKVTPDPMIPPTAVTNSQKNTSALRLSEFLQANLTNLDEKQFNSSISNTLSY